MPCASNPLPLAVEPHTFGCGRGGAWRPCGVGAHSSSIYRGSPCGTTRPPRDHATLFPQYVRIPLHATVVHSIPIGCPRSRCQSNARASDTGRASDTIKPSGLKHLRARARWGSTWRAVICEPLMSRSIRATALCTLTSRLIIARGHTPKRFEDRSHSCAEGESRCGLHS
jgi:hypothetical protein